VSGRISCQNNECRIGKPAVFNMHVEISVGNFPLRHFGKAPLWSNGLCSKR
jgi:hypothetical protein